MPVIKQSCQEIINVEADYGGAWFLIWLVTYFGSRFGPVREHLPLTNVGEVSSWPHYFTLVEFVGSLPLLCEVFPRYSGLSFKPTFDLICCDLG